MSRAREAKNDIRLDTLGTDLSDHNTLEIWQGVLDQLNLGEMPPENKPQPTKEAASRVVTTLTTVLKAAYSKNEAQARKQSSDDSTAMNFATHYETFFTSKERLIDPAQSPSL